MKPSWKEIQASEIAGLVLKKYLGIAEKNRIQISEGKLFIN